MAPNVSFYGLDRNVNWPISVRLLWSHRSITVLTSPHQFAPTGSFLANRHLLSFSFWTSFHNLVFVTSFRFSTTALIQCITARNTVVKAFAELLLVCTWRHGGHVGGQEQKHFSPRGTKLYFHVNSSRKYSFVLTPNMAALSRGCKPRIVYAAVTITSTQRHTSLLIGSRRRKLEVHHFEVLILMKIFYPGILRTLLMMQTFSNHFIRVIFVIFCQHFFQIW